MTPFDFADGGDQLDIVSVTDSRGEPVTLRAREEAEVMEMAMSGANT